MKEFKDIVENIKYILYLEYGKRKVDNEDVARSLGMSLEELSLCKFKNRIPLNELKSFCRKREIGVEMLL